MITKWQKTGRMGLALLAAITMIAATAWFAQSTVTQLSGLAVAENVPTTIWNSVRDAVSGDDLTRGVLVNGLYQFDGTNWDRMRGDTTNGIDVDVTRITGTSTPTDATSNPTTLNGVQSFGMVWNGSTWDRLPGSTSGIAVSQATSGGGFYAITDTGITTASQNFAFGFTSKSVSISTPTTNTNNVCLDWLGGTAVCPSADTAGDDILEPGTSILLDNYAVLSISAISSAGTETLIVRSWE